jgi:hypothetical protein
MNTDDLMTGLPGEKLVRQGLADLQSGLCTIPGCLVRIARPRLTRAGLMPQCLPGQFPEPELQLYELLKREGGDAYSRYNALVRELVSFENALDRRNRHENVQSNAKTSTNTV